MKIFKLYKILLLDYFLFENSIKYYKYMNQEGSGLSFWDIIF